MADEPGCAYIRRGQKLVLGVTEAQIQEMREGGGFLVRADLTGVTEVLIVSYVTFAEIIEKNAPELVDLVEIKPGGTD